MCAVEAGSAARLVLDGPLEAIAKTCGVVGGVLATEDGFPLATRLPREQDRDGMAAAAAALGRLAGKVLERLGKGKLEVAAVEASNLTFLVRRLSVGYLLVAVEPQANIESVAAEMRRASVMLEDAAVTLAGC